MPLTVAEDVLAAPFNVVKNNVLGPLMDVDVRVFLTMSLVLLALSFILTEWKSSPKSCKQQAGACFKIFKGRDVVGGHTGVYTVLEYGLLIIAQVLFFKLIARGVQAHGIRPIAFLHFAAVVGLAELANVFFVSLFQVAIPFDSNVTDQPGQEASFKELCQQYLFDIINLFRFNGSFFGSDSYVLSFTLPTVVGAVVAGSLAA